jgi:3-oxoacyl-[acyl-carrier protein] reductase
MGVRGALIVGTSTSELGAKGVTAALAEAGIEGRGAVLDVTDSESVVNVVRQIEENFGPITILVNNAGITRDNLLLRMKDEEWDDIIETNLSSAFRVTKACLRGMTRARRGRVINVTSIVGATGNPGQTNYGASKAGLVGFTKSLASEVASRGITVNAIAPGFIETDMTASLEQSRRDAVATAIPVGRLGSGEDVAAAAVFLASPEASYITGQVIHVNGGLYMSS